jgi:hypothetical protein
VLHLFMLAVTGAMMSNSPAKLASPLVTAAPSALERAHWLEAPERRVRAFAPHLQRALEHGLQRSPTFAGMLRVLEGSDVIVQIVARRLPASTHARILMGQATPHVRYLRIEVDYRRGGDDLVALIGHELRHAVEIAAAPEIRDEAALARHYRRIGFTAGGAHQFDTAAARSAERDVRRELWTPGALVLAAHQAH